jgi:hypothetical protein
MEEGHTSTYSSLQSYRKEEEEGDDEWDRGSKNEVSDGLDVERLLMRRRSSLLTKL